MPIKVKLKAQKIVPGNKQNFKRSVLSTSAKASQGNYYRRCHVCDAVSESENEILRCHLCDKPMAPFYYFDLKDMKVYTDDRLKESEAVEGFQPIQGLAVLW